MADFNFYLNTQGPRGPKGERGEPGDAITIEVAQNTVNTYTLNITDSNGTFETPNLRGSLVDTSDTGTYLRYNPETGEAYTGDAEIAVGDITGMVRFASEEELLANASNVVVSPSDIQDYLAAKLIPGDNVTINKNEETGDITISSTGGGGGGGTANIIISYEGEG